MIGDSYLWDRCEDDLKACRPWIAVPHFRSLYKNVPMTNAKFFRRIKDKTMKFGYTLNSVVEKVNGLCFRFWEFTRIIKPINNTPEVTEVPEVTQVIVTEVIDVIENFRHKTASSMRLECSQSVTIDAEPKGRRPSDKYMGTPMNRLKNGAVIVDENPTIGTRVRYDKQVKGRL